MKTFAEALAIVRSKNDDLSLAEQRQLALELQNSEAELECLQQDELNSDYEEEFERELDCLFGLTAWEH